VGSWKSVWASSDKDKAGNAVIGPVVVEGTNGSYINASSRPVIVIGLDHVAVIETEDGVLVTTLDRSQEVRRLVDRLKGRGSGESSG
jgi:mannose-1-phosphate guanylyltransferase